MLVVGIDIGSRASKAVMIKDGKVIADIICDVTMKLSERAENVFSALIKKARVKREDIDNIVATGYGRVSAPFANEMVTEITCHAKGIYTLQPSIKTVVDIGGQDSKVIKLNKKGDVIDFVMNDRCSAGTGKFLEVTSKAMGLSLDDFSRLYFKSSAPCNISSMCTVFAESEVISLQADGTDDSNIIAGLTMAVARRVGNMAKRLNPEPDFAFTGGVAKNMGVKAALEKEMGHSFYHSDYDPQLIGAYGAAVIASQYFSIEKKSGSKSADTKKKLKTTLKLKTLLYNRPKEINDLKARGGKIIGYFCCYIPIELVYAAGMIPIRLIRGGNVEVSSIGGTYLSSFSCPFACSCIGNKKNKSDFYFESVEIIADAPSCLQMKRVLEVWEKYFNVRVIHLGFPRTYYTPESLEYFSESLLNFISELEEISGHKVDAKAIEKAVSLGNEIRRLQRELYHFLSEYRLSWSDLIKFINAGNVLDRVTYRDLLKELKEEVLSQPKKSPTPLRFLLFGAMMAPGDDKLIKIASDLGVEFVMDELCSGSRPTFVDIKKPTVKKIAEAYLLNVPCGALPHPDSKTDPRLNHIKNLIDEYKINGVIYYTLRFCDAYSFKYKEVKKYLEKLKIPILHLHSDYSDADTGQIKVRLEAFCETILNKSH